MVSSPKIKNISLHNSGNQNYNCTRLAPTRGAYHDRHDTWGAGCDGRFGVRHVFSCRTKTPGRTAKSCGPGAAMLASSLWSYPQVTVAKKPAHRGEHEVSRKAIAQGMSECFRCPVCSCAPNAQFGTRDRGCSAHPAFPAPSIFEGGKEFASLGRNRAARTRSHTPPPSSLRKQGPIRRGGNCEDKVVDGFASTTTDGGYGSLLSQGRQSTLTAES